MAMQEISLNDYQAMVGKQIGHSDWFCITQDKIDQFAEVTEDRQL